MRGRDRVLKLVANAQRDVEVSAEARAVPTGLKGLGLEAGPVRGKPGRENGYLIGDGPYRRILRHQGRE
jgi:hypothetical protein